MEANAVSTKNFLAQNEATVDRFREVALHGFAQGREGLERIIAELTGLQTIAVSGGYSILVTCLTDTIKVLQNGLLNPVFVEQLAALEHAWSDVVCELLNYFVFMGLDDEATLRDSVHSRLVQLTQASASLVPMASETETNSDGSWDLFDETAAPPPSVATPAFAQAAEAPASRSAPVKAAVIHQPEALPENQLASHYLICLLGSQQYALPIHQVREILELRDEKALPSQRAGIRGLVTVRGMVCPVVDVSRILHAKNDNLQTSDRKRRCLIVCEVDRRTFCFNVDDVKQVAALHEFDDQITPLNPEGSVQNAISHVSHFQNKSVLFVKMREVIPA